MKLNVDPVGLTVDLVRCPSVTPDEGGALTLLQKILEPAGFDCHRLLMSEAGTADVDNLYARFGRGQPHLCFAGHTDVVPVGNLGAWSRPPFGAEIHDGVLYGRGAVDMKGAIACFVVAALRFIERNKSRPDFSISFLITGDEEGPSINGTMKVLEWMRNKGEVMDAAIVGEPSNPKALGDEIKIGRRGSLNGEIVVLGRQGHAAYPQLAENPVPKLARIIDRLTAMPLDQGTPDFQPSSLQVTALATSTNATNIIPADARAKFNIRYNDLWRRPKLESRVRELCAAAAAEVDARHSVSFSGTGDVFLTKPGPLVSTMREAVKSVTGRDPALTTGGGTSDARFIQAFCPVIEFGLVNATIHAVDERVPVADLEALTCVYERFLDGYFASAA